MIFDDEKNFLTQKGEDKMKKLLIILTTILAASSLFSACKINSGGNPPAKSETEKTDAKKPEKAESNPKSNALGDTAEEEGEWNLEIIRTFQIGEKPDDGDSRHGDYTVMKNLANGGTVGSLHLYEPREAIFFLWDGEVYAGPLTTVAQVEEASMTLSRELKSGHETRMDIMRNYPTGQKKVRRVYDSEGNLIREDEEP